MCTQLLTLRTGSYTPDLHNKGDFMLIIPLYFCQCDDYNIMYLTNFMFGFISIMAS